MRTAIAHTVWKTAAPVALLAVFAMACSAVQNPALVKAHLAYQNARQDPVIVRNAGADLEKAAAVLEKADQSWAKDKDAVEAEHLAYIAQKRVEIARVMAERRLAMDELQQIKSQRP
jgi:ABC-type branched-subunit amino acid transport system ATPase component